MSLEIILNLSLSIRIYIFFSAIGKDCCFLYNRGSKLVTRKYSKVMKTFNTQ